MRVDLTLRLRPGVDDDLIAFFKRVPPGKRCSALKAGLRTGNVAVVDVDGLPSDDDFLNALGSLVEE